MDVPDLSGISIRGYHVVRKMGEGGFSVLYLVWETATETSWVMKVLKPSPEVRKDYFREKHVYELFSADLSCQNAVVQAHKIFTHPIETKKEGRWVAQRYYIFVLERMDGDLTKYLNQFGWLGPVDLLDFMVLLLEGLVCIHSQRVAHGDIKLENILYFRRAEEEEEVFTLLKYTDFGFTCTDAASQEWIEKKLRECLVDRGSPLYISPARMITFQQNQQYALSLREAQRDDLWALAMVFRFLGTGRYPFARFNTPEIHFLSPYEALEIIQYDPILPSPYRSDHPRLDAIINDVIDYMSHTVQEESLSAASVLEYLEQKIETSRATI